MIRSDGNLDLKCLVIGVGGFLGTTLCARLSASSAEARGFGPTNRYPDVLKGVEFIEGVVADTDLLEAALEGVDVVFHLMGGSTVASAELDRRADLINTVGGSIAILDACVASGVERVIFSSSGGTVYGAASEKIARETTQTRPISTYGANKLSVEHYLSLYNHLYGMRNISLRISNPFGPYQHGNNNQGIVSVFARNIIAGNPVTLMGDGSVKRDFVYAGDVADAFIASAAYTGSREIFNIGSGIARSILQVLHDLEATLGKKAIIESVPFRPFDVKTSALDTTLARDELGWTAKKSWEDGLQATTDWIKSDMADGGI